MRASPILSALVSVLLAATASAAAADAGDTQSKPEAPAVVFDVTLAPNGSILRAVPRPSADPALESEAITALNHWEFDPAPTRRERVGLRYTVVVKFPTDRPREAGPLVWVLRCDRVDEEGNPAPTTAAAEPPNQPAADIVLPKLLTKRFPRYPEWARERDLPGKVVLMAVVKTDGTVDQVEVLNSSNEHFNQAAIDSVTQWTYTPATKNGSPIEIHYTVQMAFSRN